jgi:hypothetical protein
MPLSRDVLLLLRRLVPSLLVAVSLLATAAHAQTAGGLQLADVPGAWVVEVTITGGFLGNGKGGAAINSEGAAVCIAPQTCATTVGHLIDATTTAIAQTRTESWNAPFPAMLCTDCFVTRVTVRRRLSDMSEQVTVFAWTDGSATSVPSDIRALYDRVIAIVRR